MAPEPGFERLPPAIKLIAIIALNERTWWRYSHRSLIPGRSAPSKFGQRRVRLGGSIDPGFEGFPVFGRYSDNGAVQHLRFSGLQGLPAHEITQIRMGKLRRGLEDGALVGIDPTNCCPFDMLI